MSRAPFLEQSKRPTLCAPGEGAAGGTGGAALAALQPKNAGDRDNGEQATGGNNCSCCFAGLVGLGRGVLGFFFLV